MINIDSYKNQALPVLLQWKKEIEDSEYISFADLDLLFSHYASEIIHADMLKRQLQHALDTGGEYLEIEDIEH